MPIKQGDSLPNVKVRGSTPDEVININDLLGKKKTVLFAMPGAFTPGCNKKHLPGILDSYDDYRKKGVEVIACISVNDPFVMGAWAKEMNTGEKIKMLSDPKAEFTKAIGMEFDMTEMLGGIRSKRYAMLIEDGKVKQLAVEPDGKGMTCSLAPEFITLI